MKFIFWFPVYIVWLWACAAPSSVAAEDVKVADCFKNDLAPATRFVACRVVAEAGHADAQYSLGYMYSTGEGVPQNYAAAAGVVSPGRRAGTREMRRSISAICMMWARASRRTMRRRQPGIVRPPSRETPRHSLTSASYITWGQGVAQDYGGGASLVSSGRRTGRRSGTV